MIVIILDWDGNVNRRFVYDGKVTNELVALWILPFEGTYTRYDINFESRHFVIVIMKNEGSDG